jgi:AcrR family transcriptional regulator
MIERAGGRAAEEESGGEDDLKGQARRGAASRQAILEAALSVFARRGFRGGGLAEVANLVELTPAGVLYHFGSKEALLLAVIQERDRRAAELGADLGPAGGLESLKGLVRFAEMSEAEPGLVTLHTVLQIENLDPSDPAHEYFRARTRFVQRWGEEMIRSAQASGEVRDDVDAKAKAREIAAYLEGAAVLWLMNPELSLTELYRTYLESVVDQIAVAAR